jgi:hypothetical protein
MPEGKTLITNPRKLPQRVLRWQIQDSTYCQAVCSPSSWPCAKILGWDPCSCSLQRCS